MKVYWQSVRRGQNLMLSDEGDGREERIGGFRENRQGIDAYAATFGYEPGRSEKGFPSIEDAKVFVESFRPWELFGAQGITVEPGVREAAGGAPASAATTPDPPADTSRPEPDPFSITASQETRRRWWEFWKRG